MSETAHPELDETPLLGPEDHSRFGSPIGCANWLITLVRFDIAHAGNVHSRFSMAPKEGHLQGMIRVFGYLKKWNKGAIVIDPKHPDHPTFDVTDHQTWQEFYPDAEEMVPGESERPKALGEKARITVCKDSDHAHDVVTRRSVTGVMLFINNTPVKLISKCQNTMETSTHGAASVAGKVATE